MSSGKRKLSFLGFAPSQAEGEEINLDEEMDRVVWGEGSQPLDAARLRSEPRRDSAAPPPREYPLVSSSSDLTTSDPQNTSTESPRQTSSGTASTSPRDDSDRHVQFDGQQPPHDVELDDASEERRTQRTA